MIATDITTSTGAGEITSTSAESRPRLSTAAMWAILAVVLIADVMDLLDSTLTNIAAPSIVRDIGGGVSLIKWLGSGYALAMGVLLVVGGRLGDKYGQRRLFLTGMIGFTVASAACGLAVNPGMLITARLFQGGFGALLIPQGIAIMTARFSRDFMTKAFSVFGPMLGVAMVGGPLLGGAIINANIAGLGWRPMFLINIVLGTAGCIAALRLLPKDEGDRSIEVDGIGAVFLGGTMLGLMYGLIEGSTTGWTILPVACMAAGVACFGLFCYRQGTTAQPLIKPTLLKNRGFTAGLFLGIVFFAAVSGLMYVLSLFFQEGIGRSAGGTAVDLVPMAIGIVIASVIGAQLIPILGRTLIFVGLLVAAAGAGAFLAAVLAAGLHVNTWAIEPAILVMGIGLGLCFGTLFDAALSAISAEEAGSASGSLSAVQQLAGCIGSAAITTVYFHVLTSGTHPDAMVTCLSVVLGILVLCFAFVWLLPKKIRSQQ